MHRILPSLAVAATLAIVGATTPAASAQEKAPPVDAVVRSEGGAQKVLTGGKIESADFEQVVYSKDGRKTNVPAADVVEVRWGDAPPEWDAGLRALDSRDGEGARKAFASCLAAKEALPNLRDWVKEFANAGLGDACLLLAAQDPKLADKAADAFAAARAANAKALWTDRILRGLAEAELLRGKPEGAVRAGDELVAAGKAAKRPAWELDGHLIKARAQQQSGNFTGAVAAYDDVIRFAESAAGAEKSEAAKARYRSLGLDASARKGWAMVAKAEASKSQAELDAARSYFAALAQKHPGEPIAMAAASNAQGVAKLGAGDVRGALFAFQETEVLWFQASNEVARSLWYQSQCWTKLNDAKQASERVRDLKEFHPGSEWARKAP